MKEILINHWDTILISLIVIVSFIVIYINKENKRRN